MADTGGALPRGPRKIWCALQWSCKGIRTAFQTESSFRLETYVFLVLGPGAFFLGDNAVERALMFGALLLVMSAELLNSAIEQIVDKISPEYAEFAGRAKDMGSAAVLLAMINAVAIWLAALWPNS